MAHDGCRAERYRSIERPQDRPRDDLKFGLHGHRYLPFRIGRRWRRYGNALRLYAGRVAYLVDPVDNHFLIGSGDHGQACSFARRLRQDIDRHPCAAELGDAEHQQE